MHMEFPLFVLCCVFVAVYATSWLLIRGPTVFACLSYCVCDVGTSTNSHSSPQFDFSTTESNINFTYRHLSSNRRLLPPLRQCGFSNRVDPIIRRISESAMRIASNHILTGIPDMRDSREAVRCVSSLRPC